MAWKANDRHTFMGRIPQKDGPAVVRSFGTGDPDAVKEIHELLKRLKRYGNFTALSLLADRHISAFDLYRADKQGQLAVFVDDAVRKLTELEESDLDAVLADWANEGGNPRYVKQCRQMIPEGERFPVSKFTRKACSKFLRTLKVQQPTKNRYRAALMQFAKYLIEAQVIELNPVAQVASFKENEPRIVFYDDATARSVINALEYPYKALEAFMCGTGVEWSAAVRARPATLNKAKRSIFAPGTKNKYRKREVRFLESWCWNVFIEYADNHVGDLPYFAKLDHDDALKAHHAAVKVAEAQPSVLHDWRHTFAIRERRKGTDNQVIKAGLGHDMRSVELERVYGSYKPEDSDYERTVKPIMEIAK